MRKQGFVIVCMMGMLPSLLPGGGYVSVAAQAERIQFGVYDPAGLFQDTNMHIEQQFVSWKLDDPSPTLDAVASIVARGRFPLIASESWSWEPYQDFRKETLLTDVAQGRYDSTISGMCAGLGRRASQQVWFRWGAEMDLNDHKPWQQGNPPAYIAAYRHIVTTCRATGATNIRFVWSPAGDASLAAYYPGDDVVDIIGLTVLEFEPWNRIYGHGARSFDDIFGEKHRLVRGFQKPVIVAEMGVSGDAAYKAQWLRDARQTYAKYPLLKATIYFNDVNPTNFAGFGYTPDWRIEPTVFP